MIIRKHLALCTLASTALAQPITVSQVKYPIVENGPSDVQFTYPGYGLDGPRVNSINSTVFDWWYFDAVSENVADGDYSSIVAVFHDGTSGGFQALPETPSKLQFAFSGTYPNGTHFYTYLLPSEAVVSADTTGSRGNWGNFGRWEGDVETGIWEASFDVDRALGDQWIISDGAGASEIISPHVGWVNTVPDGRMTVELDINGTNFNFTGVGYHDKNWADRPFFNASVLSWYWGHARAGPYSIVWFDALDNESTEHFSAYISRDGEVLTSNCEDNAVVVRPWGGEDTYPPPAGTATPNGFILTFAEVERREFVVNVTNYATPVQLPLYNRFIGTAEGRFEGEEEVFVGSASYEQFKAA